MNIFNFEFIIYIYWKYKMGIHLSLPFEKNVYKGCKFEVMHKKEVFIFYLNKRLNIEATIWDTTTEQIRSNIVSVDVSNNIITIKDNYKSSDTVKYESIITIDKQSKLIVLADQNYNHIKLLRKMITDGNLTANQLDGVNKYLNIVNIITNDEYI